MYPKTTRAGLPDKKTSVLITSVSELRDLSLNR